VAPASSADPFASRAAASAKAGEGPSPAADGRDALPQASAKAVSNVTFGSASSALTKQFAPVTRSVSTVVTGTQLRSVSLGGRPLGGVALYEVPAAVSASTQFQDQFVVQLLSTLAAGSAPTFVRIEGKPVAVCHGAKACAGWFDGTRAVIVVRESGSTTPEVFAASILKHAKAL
jgi:hypothetical protein